METPQISTDSATPFSNIQVQVENLPTIESLVGNKLDKGYLLVVLITSFLFWTILLGAAYFFLLENPIDLPKEYHSYILGALALLALSMLVINYLGFFKKSYSIRTKDLIYSTGLFWRSITTIPFNRVQHCEVKQGPIERMFDLAQIRVFTAGGSQSDLTIPGLKPDQAKSIKEFILNKTAKSDEQE